MDEASWVRLSRGGSPHARLSAAFHPLLYSRRASHPAGSGPMSDFKVTELSPETDFDALDHWDVIIIGAGPAGLAASLTTAHRGLTTLVIEATDKPGGQPQFLYPDKKIVDIPGFPDGITGEELSERTFRQAASALVQFRFQEELVSIEETDRTEKDDPLKEVVT